ncbi:MAG: hypothetical protein AABW87_02900 [Nanoarchaeota archaeon]
MDADFHTFVDEANKSFQTADHLTYSTYPLVKDPKLLLVIAENLFKALSKGMEAIVYYERLYKRIPPINDDFNSKFEVFREKCAPRYNLPRDSILLMRDLKNILDHHKKSPTEFRKGYDRFIMADRNLTVKTLDISKVKNYLHLTKSFIFKVNSIYNRINSPHSKG